MYTHAVALDPDAGDSLKYSIYTRADWLELKDSDNAQIITGVPDKAHIGSHVVTIRAEDLSGEKASARLIIVVSDKPQAPEIPNLNFVPENLWEALKKPPLNAYSIDTSLTHNPNYSPMSLKLSALPQGITFNRKKASFRVKTPISHVLKLALFDSQGVADMAELRLPAKINTPPLQRAVSVRFPYSRSKKGESIYFTYKDFQKGFTDADGDELKAIRITSLPNASAKLHFVEGRVPSFTVIDRKSLNLFNMKFREDFIGDTNFLFQASDGESYSNQTEMRVYITDENHPPEVSCENMSWDACIKPIQLTARVSKTFETDLSKLFIDKDGIVDKYYLSGALPSDVKFDSSIGILKGWPKKHSIGQYNFGLTAYDDRGATAWKEIILNITSKNQPPSCDEQSFGVVEGYEISFQISATDKDNDKLTYSIISKPKYGIIENFNKQTGIFTYKYMNALRKSDSALVKVDDGVDSSTCDIKFTINR